MSAVKEALGVQPIYTGTGGFQHDGLRTNLLGHDGEEVIYEQHGFVSKMREFDRKYLRQFFGGNPTSATKKDDDFRINQESYKYHE